MEADGSSPNFCAYCNKAGHQSDQCRDQVTDRRVEIGIGCLVGGLLLPFAIIGFVLGFAGSAAWGGIRYGFESWSRWTAQMKKLFRKEKS